uniref:NAD(P)(+)--arginine ADP-ribosyltransferase n=1 Tax=Catharus ustulatus TaxID=91951 RepID=A0A8C3UFU3_CATUS
GKHSHLRCQSSFAFMLQATSPALMDVALHPFDDQYPGCREEMMKELEQGDYFLKEIAANKDYFHLWKKAQKALLKSPAGLLRGMLTLNRATATAGISTEHYRHQFSFKYFHFYLTTAIQMLKEWQSSMGEHKCYQVHRGVKDLHIEAKVGSRVRFGHFTSTSRLRNEAQKFGIEKMAFVGKGCVSKSKKLWAVNRYLNDCSLYFLSASRSKNSGNTALASALLPSVLGVSLCLAHTL